MKIGFIGAGKVGFSLGKYFCLHGADVGGYYSKNPLSALKAADFTSSRQYNSLDEILCDNDALLLTVPDGEILPVWNSLKKLPGVKNKIICHCSGALSSEIFFGREDIPVYGYSVHPIFPVCSRTESYQQLSDAIFTIEGSPRKINEIVSFISGMGNVVRVIGGQAKTKYHAATVMASNQMTALIHTAIGLLCECGFSQQDAMDALIPLMSANLSNIAEIGTVQALTGPVERNDVSTVKNHLECLDNGHRALYCELSQVLVEIARAKYPERNYDEIEGLLE